MEKQILHLKEAIIRRSMTALGQKRSVAPASAVHYKFGEAAHSSPLIARHGPSTASPAEGQSGSETQQQASEHASAPQATQTVIELTATNRYHSSSHEASSPPIRGGDQHSLTALLNDLRHHGTQMTLKERRNAEAILRAKYGAITQQLLQQDDQ
ncbi:hypothetical protein cyc_02230 [Cyclospora cayetanensis]|uniref:Uncharacterized protein n=1 Tax=Cyclospora cayetanensis TaxID=88456 RepID=A0A1D3D8V3_9EIME|nr:hypothetical protein cyc_02230 [Cyclospora cayetanensis]